MKVLAEAGAVLEVEVVPEGAGGWVIWVSYISNNEPKLEALERQRGGVRVFATLEAVAHTLALAGLPSFRVSIKPP